MPVLPKIFRWLHITAPHRSTYNISEWRNFDYNAEKSIQTIVEHLEKENAFLSCAESCTGGYVSHIITCNQHLSKHYNGSIISYSPEVKTDLLAVSELAVKTEQAVNDRCAREMLQGVLAKFKTQYGIAITGFAGPDGGTDENPVGTVWIAVGNAERNLTKRHRFGTNRDENIRLFAYAALEQLALFLQTSHTV